MKKIICIINYNTQELTEAVIYSAMRNGGDDFHFVIFDNSDKKPWHTPDTLKDIAVINNTDGQFVNFERELANYPRKRKSQGCDGLCIFGSVKHMMSVEWLVQNMEGAFLLADSDILIKSDITELWQEEYTATGTIEKDWSYGVSRLQPYLCFINAPECRRLGLHYFDPMRTWGLGTGRTEKANWYDTGASFLEDVQYYAGAHFKEIDNGSMIEHLGHGSWKGNGGEKEWLYIHRELWNPQYIYSGPTETIKKFDINMENVHTFSQDGKQYRMTAHDGYLLRAKDTGDIRHSVNTMNTARWEVIEDPDFKQPEKKTGKKTRAKKSE